MKENNEVVNANKTVYKFKPASHWNYITREQYEFLLRFFADEGRLMITQEEE